MGIDDGSRLFEEPFPVGIVNEPIVENAESLVNPKTNVGLLPMHLLLPFVAQTKEKEHF